MRSALFCFVFILMAVGLTAQEDSGQQAPDSFRELYLRSEKMRITDSIRRVQLTEQYNQLKESEQREKLQLQAELERLAREDSLRRQEMLQRISQVKQNTKGHAVTVNDDTLFYIYNRVGATMPTERAEDITRRIQKIADADFFSPDSIMAIEGDGNYDIVYGDMVVMTVTETDALWHDETVQALAIRLVDKIRTAIVSQRSGHGFLKLLTRIGLVVLVIAGIWLLIRFINFGHQATVNYVTVNKDRWLKSLSYKDYTFLSAEQELNALFVLFKVVRWFFILLLLYLVLPLVFSIFPFTRGWAGELFRWVWSPFKGIFVAVWEYLPNLFSIVVIYVVMKYFIRFVRYVFSEIQSERLKISGFHADWAIPTFSIVRFLLYAFMFVLIFPYLPGSDSEIFKGVSVFIGLLFSLGSSTAIANMVAGLVITYMRPFRIGDRIKIGDMTGDVIEKTLLVTRLRTVKNEEITIPNASVLSGNTINYSAIAHTEGLVIHTTVTIGYDVPWRDMHQALIDAALQVDLIIKEPLPFVLQTALNDFYVSYQINAYTHYAGRQALIYSELHKNIQDVCNERGIEILSPHYRAQRDGNQTTIPADYLSPDYKAPAFNVVVTPPLMTDAAKPEANQNS